ncbi:hypothetical protein [uncultured Vibrio sp.]|uniref:hypothetical protein n=1 Tax=uncultured Vibrio sp. TaxID=114054 RepID=UPI00261012F1|nr:hypothetical protein [uncultured Vibrio sp.]
MSYKIRDNCIFEHIDVYETQEELQQYLNAISAPLGLFVMEFNALEDEISMYLTEAYEMSDIAINPKKLCQMYRDKEKELIKLYKGLVSHDNELMKSLHELKELLMSSSSSRNDFVHASWLYASPSQGVACSKDKSTYRKFELSDIQKSHNTVTTARGHLIHFHNRVQRANKLLKSDS